jgi:hypothetical protein
MYCRAERRRVRARARTHACTHRRHRPSQPTQRKKETEKCDAGSGPHTCASDSRWCGGEEDEIGHGRFTRWQVRAHQLTHAPTNSLLCTYTQWSKKWGGYADG